MRDRRIVAIRSGFQNHLAKGVERGERLAVVSSVAGRKVTNQRRVTVIHEKLLRRIDQEFPASLLPLNFGRVLDRRYHLVPAHHLRLHSVCPGCRRKFLRGLAQFYPSLGSLCSFLLVP